MKWSTALYTSLFWKGIQLANISVAISFQQMEKSLYTLGYTGE